MEKVVNFEMGEVVNFVNIENRNCSYVDWDPLSNKISE
jgi:hypothetical protein